MRKLFECRASFDIWDDIKRLNPPSDTLPLVNHLLMHGGTYLSKDITRYIDLTEAERLFEQGILQEGEDFVYFAGCEEYVESPPKDPSSDRVAI